MRTTTKITILAAAAALGSVGASAETVSQKQASKVAQLFSNVLHGQVMAQPQLAWNGKKLTTQQLFTPFYVYNLGGGGWVIISADNKAFPILGYSETGHFDKDRLTDTEREWLRSYARDIEMIRYDSRVPYDAIDAWGDLGEYVTEVIKTRPAAEDRLFSPSAAQARLDEVDFSDDASLTDSYLYTPAQWQDMLIGQIQQYGDVTVGLERGNDLLPVQIYSAAGDYHVVQTDMNDANGNGVWKMRLNATEYLAGGMLADIGNPIEITVEEVEDKPFEEQDEFLAEVSAAPAERAPIFDEVLYPSKPQVRGLGGGYFEVSFPQQVAFTAVYDVNGSLVQSSKYSGSQTANIDLAALPGGFYLLIAEGEDSAPYSLKLWR